MAWMRTGKPVLVRPSVARGKLLELVASLPPCLIGMEACSGAHHWARLFHAHGHTVRLMAPEVRRARIACRGKRGKNDAADAAAICEAVHAPQHALRAAPRAWSSSPQLMVHRARQGFVAAAHGHHQPHPRPAVGVRHRAAAEGRHRAARGDARSWRICPAGPTR